MYDQSQTALSRQLITDLTSLTALQEPQFVFSEDAVVDFLRRQETAVVSHRARFFPGHSQYITESHRRLFC